MDAVQRRGSAARMNYIKRFLSVLVAFVLCLGLIQPPMAKAVVPAVVLAYGTGVALSAVASVLGSFIAAYVGLRIEQPMIQVGDGYVMGTGGYDFGSLIWPAVVVAGSAAVKKWWSDTTAFFEAKGGFAPGDEITIPADVAEFARNWIVENYDFTTGDVTITQTGIMSDSAFIQFFADGVSGTQLSLGSTVTIGSYQFSFTRRVENGKDMLFYSCNGFGYSSSWSAYMETRPMLTGFCVVKDSLGADRLILGSNDSASGDPANMWFHSAGSLIVGKFPRYSDIASSVYTLSSSVASTDALNTPVTKDMTVAIPKDVAMGKVGVWDIPATTELTKEGILVGQGEVVQPTAVPQPTAIPGEGTMVGDIAIEGIQTAAQDKGLGALFISKFPFCIPWDFVNAVKLLAAPPKTPYWEVDFLAPVAYRFGGFKGDTTLVIDFSDYEILGQLCRWVSTIMFISALAQGTKRLIWTA